MSLPTVWPVKRLQTTEQQWKCEECPYDEFVDVRPTFASLEDLDTHRRQKHGKHFDGDINLKQAEILKHKRTMFERLKDLVTHREEEE